jgi:Na+-transporting NADH:ubiquinone oxidoreductase subunit NqrD
MYGSSSDGWTAGLGCGALLVVLALILSFVVSVSALFGWVFMLLWNFAVAPTFQLPELSFWVAWAIWFLIGMISSGFRATFSSKKKD